MIASHDADEIKKAQGPHELFLFNLIFNHVLLFIVTISAPSLQFLVFIVPSLSVSIVTYTLVASRRSSRSESPFVTCHWRLAARRTLMLVALWLCAAAFFGIVLTASGGTPRPWHYAVGSLAFIPTMFLMIGLVVMESEALAHARAGSLPKAAHRRCLLHLRPTVVPDTE